MSLPEISIRRPVLATVMSLLVVAAGLMSAQRLPVRELPDTDAASVTIRTAWRGAAPEAVDSQITEKVEAAIAGVSGVRRIESDSGRGGSRTTVRFAEGIDVDRAAEDVRAAVAGVRGKLPDNAEEPVVYKNDDDADPVMRLGLTSDRMSAEEMTDYAERRVLDRLATLPGVSRAEVSGRRAPALRIELDPAALAARDMTATEALSALSSGNIELPAGEISSDQRVFQMRADARLRSPEDFRALVIRSGPAGPVRLGDVAEVREGALAETSLVRSGGRLAVGLTIQRQSQSNVVAISDAVRAEVEKIRPTLPEGMNLQISSDDAIFIRASTEEVVKTLLIAVGLVSLVILVFIGSPRAAVAPIATIPVALIGALAGIWMLGYSINILTLFALILAIGLVVDDSIVVLEACQRRVERGEPPAAAAMRGSKAVTFAVLATTATLISVFLPIGFLEGQVGRLFAEFGAVLSIAVIVSTFVALTLAPAICSRVLRRDSGGALERLAAWTFGMAERGYRATLRVALANPLVVVGVAAGLGGAAFWLDQQIPKELAPKEDRGYFFVPVTGPDGASLDSTIEEVAEVERRLQPLLDSGEAELIFTVAGTSAPNRGFVVVRLAPWEKRARSSQEIVRAMIGPMVSLPGARAFPIQPSGLGLRGSSSPLRVLVQGPDFDSVAEWTEILKRAMEQEPGISDVSGGMERNQPEIRVQVDRALAADLGISARAVADAIQVFFAGPEVDGYMVDGRERPVRVQAAESFRRSAEDLGAIYVRGGGGAMIPLSAIATVETGAATPSLRRFDRLPSARIDASLVGDLDLGSAIATVERLAAEHLPPDALIAWDGQSREYLETSGGAMWTFVIALIVVYLVLAAQFESFLDPVAIMLSVPLSVTGALATVWWLGESSNIYTQIGLILLVGLMAKNGILIVEYANQLRDEGLGVREAALEASVERLRPVVMTVVSTVLGAAPLAWSSGAGAEAREAIGWVVMGGFGFASFLTLYLTPVLWDRLARFSGGRAEASRRIEAAMAAPVSERGAERARTERDRAERAPGSGKTRARMAAVLAAARRRPSRPAPPHHPHHPPHHPPHPPAAEEAAHRRVPPPPPNLFNVEEEEARGPRDAAE